MSRLRDVLERASLDHRRDVKVYCSGHLNENNLRRPGSSDETRRQRWRSSATSHDGVSRPKQRRSPLLAATTPMRVARKRSSVDFATLPALNGEFSRGFSNSSSSSPVRQSSPEERFLLSPETTIMVRRSTGAANFVEPLVREVRKSDQLKRLEQLDVDVIARGRVHQRKALRETDGVMEVRRSLERKTSKRPSYQGLRTFSDAFSRIADANETFGSLLRRIKNAYDEHVSYLLDAQRLSQQTDHIEVLKTKEFPQKTSTVDSAKRTVESLEAKAKELLLENDRLREELQREVEAKEKTLDMSTAESTKGEKPATAMTYRTITAGRLRTSTKGERDLPATVERLHKELYQKMEDLGDIQRHLYHKMVPSLECVRLEHCLKETEAHIQKLLKHNDFLQDKMEELESNLEAGLEKTNTSQRDVRQLWRRVNAFKVTATSSQKKLSQSGE